MERQPKAFSYIRFSTSSQGDDGKDSLRRQMEAGDRFCHEQGILLDTTLNLRDLAVSGFTGKNAEKALGVFLAEVEKGIIVQSGDFLIIESIDRLSRQKPTRSYDIIRKILSGGVNIAVVSLYGTTIYSEDSLNENTGQIYQLWGEMQRAYGESKRKSELTTQNWKRKFLLARNAQLPYSKKGVSWLTLVDGQWVQNADKVNLAKRVFQMYLDGMGCISIARKLNAEGIPTFGRGSLWRESGIYRTFLTNRAVLGHGVMNTKDSGKKREEIPFYYGKQNAIISEITFDQVKAKLHDSCRQNGNRAASLKNLFSNIAKCGECGESMCISYSATTSNKARLQNKKYDYNYYYICSGAKRGTHKSNTLRYADVEEAILTYISDHLDINNLLHKEQEQSEIAQLHAQIAVINDLLKILPEQKRKWLFHLAQVEEESPTAKDLIQMIDGANANIELKEAELDSLRSRLVGITSVEAHSKESLKDVHELIRFMGSTENPEEVHEARNKLRSSLRSLFRIIKFYNAHRTFTIVLSSGIERVIRWNSDSKQYELVWNDHNGIEMTQTLLKSGLPLVVPARMDGKSVRILIE